MTEWDTIPKKPMKKQPRKGSHQEVAEDYTIFWNVHRLSKKKPDFNPYSRR